MKEAAVGVLGCGLMGSGIAEVAARAGHQVRVYEIDRAALEAGRDRVERSLERGVGREKLTPRERDAAVSRISYGTDLRALSDRDLVIEAVVEDLKVKTELLRRLDAIAVPDTILASNTSSLSITEMAAAVRRTDRVIGLHFFNPVPVMRLVEIVRTIATSEHTMARVTEFALGLGKEVIAVQDRPGFLVNRLLIPFILDAVRLLEAGAASVPEIDRAMVLGCGHPMGPLTLCDFVGLDTVQRIAGIMYREYRDTRFAPPPLLNRLVVMGRYGKKSGAGFFDYSSRDPVPLRI